MQGRDGTLLAGGFAEEPTGVGGSFAFVFVFAVGVDIDALGEPGVETLFPGGKLLGRVVFETQADIGEAGGDEAGRSLLFGFGEAERGVVLAKDGVGFFGVPGWVANFESEKESGRAKREEVFEQGLIEFESGRKLNEDRAELVAVFEDAGDFEKTLEDAFAIAESMDVGDLLIGFQREAESWRDGFRPIEQQLFGGHAIEAVIDFDGGEPLAIEIEHFAIGKFFGIEVALPLFVRVAGSADAKLAGLGNERPPCSDANDSRLALFLRFLRRGHLDAEQLYGVFETLARSPKIGPEVALFFEAGMDGFDVEGFRAETGAKLVGRNWRGNGRFGKGARGIGGRERAAMRVLLHVDENAARGTFGDDALVGDEIRMLGGYGARNDFAEGAKLLVGVNGFDGNVDVEAGGAGCLQKMLQAEGLQLFVESFGDGDDDGKIGAIGGIEVEEKIVRMLGIADAVGPWVVVNAAEAGEKKERGAIASGGVVNLLATLFGVYRNGLEPIGQAFAQILLKKRLALDAAGITAQNEGAILEKRKDAAGDGIVVGEEIALGVAGLGEIDFIEIGEMEAFAAELDVDGFRAAAEEFGFDLGLGGENAARNFGRLDNNDWGRGSGFDFFGGWGVVFPGAVGGADVFAESDENGMAEGTLIGPTAEFDAGDQFRRDPRRFLVGFGHGLERGLWHGQVFQLAAHFRLRGGIKTAADMANEAEFLAVVQAQEQRTEGEGGRAWRGPAADDGVDG